MLLRQQQLETNNIRTVLFTKLNETANENNSQLYNATERSVLLLLIHQILTFIQGLSGVGNLFLCVCVNEFGSLTIATIALYSALHCSCTFTVVIIHICDMWIVSFVVPYVFRSRYLCLSPSLFFLRFLLCLYIFCITFETKRNT